MRIREARRQLSAPWRAFKRFFVDWFSRRRCTKRGVRTPFSNTIFKHSLQEIQYEKTFRRPLGTDFFVGSSRHRKTRKSQCRLHRERFEPTESYHGRLLAKGSVVTLNGATYPGEQLSGGTEGGDPYLQAVNNAGGYNITMSGGDFTNAFNGVAVANGRVSLYVDFFNEHKYFEATCVGSFSFSRMPSMLPPGARVLPAPSVCKVTPQGITTVLLSNSDSLLELKKANLYQGQSVSSENTDQGVKTFEVKFSTCGNCLSKNAVLTITQDLRPTFRDGAPIYTSRIQY